MVGVAIVLSLTVAGREVPKNRVGFAGNSDRTSNHAKFAEQPRIDPDRALLLTLLEEANTVASVSEQPERVSNLDAADEAGVAINTPNLAQESEPRHLPEEHATEETNTIPSAEATDDKREDHRATLPREHQVKTPKKHAEAQEPKSSSGHKQSQSAYGAGVHAALARHKPRTIAHGSTTVSFAIEASGALGDVRLRNSSGNKQLDQVALQMVREAAPFSPPPHGAADYTIRIDFQ